MKPFFSYLGGKYRLSKNGAYDAPPPDATVVEPFAGSAGYCTAHNVKNAVLYDKFDKIVLAWEFLINTTREELDAMPDRVDHIDDFPYLNDHQKMIIRWLITRADRRPRNQMSKWARESWPNASVWGPKRKQLILDQVENIRNWKIIHDGYENIPINNYDDNTWWFVDPPYIDLKEENSYTHGPNGINFNHLGEWCRNLPGKVIVCEMEGADWLPFRHLRDCRSSTKSVYSEVVWTKGID